MLLALSGRINKGVKIAVVTHEEKWLVLRKTFALIFFEITGNFER